MDNKIFFILLLFTSGIYTSPVTQRVEIIPSKLLTFDDQEVSRLKPRHFESSAATAAPLVLETHRVVPNQLFTLSSTDYKPELPHPFAPQTFPPLSPTFPPVSAAFSAASPAFPPPSSSFPLQTHSLETLTHAVRSNPVVTALLLSSLLGHRQPVGQNSPSHIPPDPFIALLLSHYGRYLPKPGQYKGLYGYNASNNIHNTKPFGSYKIYDDSS